MAGDTVKVELTNRELVTVIGALQFFNQRDASYRGWGVPVLLVNDVDLLVERLAKERSVFVDAEAD